MAVKKGNKIVPITLTPFHLAKLAVICERMNLSNTAIVRRWIEQYDLFDAEQKKLEARLKASSGRKEA